MKDIIFITFDVKKDEYPAMPYSIAVLMASLKRSNLKVSHYSIDVQHAMEEKGEKENLTDRVTQKLSDNQEYFRKFRFVAISLTAWSVDYCRSLLNFLDDYSGKIIFGGYEVTSAPDKMLVQTFPRVDYFIKGYAETALRKIVAEGFTYPSQVVTEKIGSEDIASPYLTGILGLTTRKIHWETKRGCRFRCGFCEWGNASIGVIEINKDQLLNEIQLFRSSGIDEINILDGTFNSGDNYLGIFKELLGIDAVKITCQARFEMLVNKDGEEFLRLISENRHRVHLELGLQTIHKHEMKVIGRGNNPEKIERALRLLKEHGVEYEVSIIYAIPGQTVESFIDTIEFLIDRGCRNIKAYPLRIPKNSRLDSIKDKLQVEEGQNEYNIPSVQASLSFPHEQRKDMEIIANRLNSGALLKITESVNPGYQPEDYFTCRTATTYQWEVLSMDKEPGGDAPICESVEHFIQATMEDIWKHDFRQGITYLGAIHREFATNKTQFIRNIISGKFCFELKGAKLTDMDLIEDGMVKETLKQIDPNAIPRKYWCKVRIAKSGNVYVFRAMQFK